MGLPEKLSPELEAKLATFLNDDEIASVRESVQAGHKKQMGDLADMQINMMGITNLSTDQKSRMREIFMGKDVMTEQLTQFAEIMRDRATLDTLLSGEGNLGAHMDKGFEPLRRRVRDILNDQQFARYQTYEKGMVQIAEMNLKWMSTMMKPETPRPEKR